MTESSGQSPNDTDKVFVMQLNCQNKDSTLSKDIFSHNLHMTLKQVPYTSSVMSLKELYKVLKEKGLTKLYMYW